MSVSVIANNTTIKISAAVSASGANNGTNDTDTLYTCPASSYAIVQLSLVMGTGTPTATFKIDGNPIAFASVATGPGFNGDSNSFTLSTSVACMTGVYIGPSQVLSVTWAGTTTNAVARVTGVEFINTP